MASTSSRPRGSKCLLSLTPTTNNYTLPRRPSSSISSITIPASISVENQWVGQRINKGSWVLMQPRRPKRSSGINVYRSAWKARVLDFKVEIGKRSVKEVLVQHVFTHPEVIANGGNVSDIHQPRCNYVYPSSYEQWEPVECIIGLFHVVHAHIGSLQYSRRSSKRLADEGIFFYDHFYQLSSGNKNGMLVKVPLPTDWNTVDWPVPKETMVEAMQIKLYKDIQRSLRSSIPTKLVRIANFCPVALFIELFHSYNIQVTKTMFMCKSFQQSSCDKLLDKGWYAKEEIGLRCEVALDTLVVKYMIASQWTRFLQVWKIILLWMWK
ncbi:hypothetical protein GOP47_0029631 [Adiantum capillus-veneris]|nr:hypothetical protein GOP47_0029631 [Adiantum capillus-veneris]